MRHVKTIVVAFFSLLLLVGGVQIMANEGYDVDYASDVFAVNSTGLSRSTCAVIADAAFTPGFDYTATENAATIGAAPGMAGTLAIINAVNSDAAPAVAESIFLTGAGLGVLDITHLSGLSKLSNLNCQLGATAMEVSFHGDGVDGAISDLSFSTTSVANGYQSANKADTVASGVPKEIFGDAVGAFALAQTENAATANGGDALINGENVLNDQWKTAVRIDVSNAVPDNGATTQETFTVLFSPQ